MDSICKAIETLHGDATLTCAAVLSDGTLYTSRAHGIAPLLLPVLEDAAFFRGAAVADRVIGKSAAMVLLYSGAAAVHGDVVSELAVTCLTQAETPWSAGERTAYIRNRAGDGMCPMEQSVLCADTPAQALPLLEAKYRELTQ